MLNSTTRARPGPTGPAQTFLLGPCGSPTNAVRVRVGPRRSGLVQSGPCIVEFSLYQGQYVRARDRHCESVFAALRQLRRVCAIRPARHNHAVDRA